MSTPARFTFHHPAAELRGTAPALREVRDASTGKPLGLLNRCLGGYVLRDLDGRKLDTVWLDDRMTAAAILARTVTA